MTTQQQEQSVTLTFINQEDGGVTLKITFDPPIDTEANAGHPVIAAVDICLAALEKAGKFENMSTVITDRDGEQN